MVSVAGPPDFRAFVEFERTLSGRIVNHPMTRGLVRRAVSNGWTDVSDRLRHFRVTYGRSDAFSEVDSANAEIVLDNRDRRLDPSYTGSPYYPYVRPRRRVQLRAEVPDYRGYVAVGPPLGHWPLDEASGSTAADAIGSLDGTLTGDVQLGVTPAEYPIAGYAPALVADTDTASSDAPVITIPPSSTLAITGTLTLEAWALPYSAPTGNQMLIYKFNGFRLGWLYNAGSPYLRFSVYTATVSWVDTPANTAAWNADGWNHVLGTYDGRNLSLYLNGVLIAEQAMDEEAIPYGETPVYLFSNGSGEAFAGAMAHVAIFDRAMSRTQVEERYAVATTGYLNLFTGPSEEWKPSWPGLHDGIVTVQAADGMELLADAAETASTSVASQEYGDLILADRPLVYLAMQDDNGGQATANYIAENTGIVQTYLHYDGTMHPVAASMVISNSDHAFEAAGPFGDRSLLMESGGMTLEFDWWTTPDNVPWEWTVETWLRRHWDEPSPGVSEERIPIYQRSIEDNPQFSENYTWELAFWYDITTDEFVLSAGNGGPFDRQELRVTHELALEEWYHVAARYDPDTEALAIFVGGEQIASLDVFLDRPLDNPREKYWPGPGITDGIYHGLGSHIGLIGVMQDAQTESTGGTYFTSGTNYAHWALYDQALTDEQIAARANFEPSSGGDVLATWASALSGDHADRALDYAGWPEDRRAVDPGVITVQAKEIETDFSPLEYLKELAATELGAFIIDRSGLAVYQDAYHRALYQRYVVITLTDEEGTDMPYQQIEFSYDLQELYSRVVGQRANSDTVVDVEDASSRREYGRRTLTLPTYLGTSDNDLTDLATARLDEVKAPVLRVSGCDLTLIDGNDERWPAILSLSYGDHVWIRRHPGGIGDPLLEPYRVEQIEHAWSYSTYVWTTRLVLASARYGALWVLEDPIYGIANVTTRPGPG